nr:MAG TPA: hypothetical protein [Bacteriophage sp.]
MFFFRRSIYCIFPSLHLIIWKIIISSFQIIPFTLIVWVDIFYPILICWFSVGRNGFPILRSLLSISFKRI